MHWRWQFSPVFYWLWMIILPLVTAAVGGFGIRYNQNAWLLPASILLGQLGMAFWLYWVWRILLAEKPWWISLFYALPMAVPGLNCLWIQKRALSAHADDHNIFRIHISYLP